LGRFETNFLGTSGQFWTPVSIPLSGRPSLFLSARSWADSTGTGIPDWWQLKYFACVGLDPNADPDGDGMSNLQEFLNRNSPNKTENQGLVMNNGVTGGVTAILWAFSRRKCHQKTNFHPMTPSV
jgi:hypothetical protein